MRKKRKGQNKEKKNRMNLCKYLLCGCACLIGLFYPLNVKAEEEEEKTIRIGYIDYDGFITEEEDGTYSGYGIDYLEELSKYTGWNYEFVYDSWENHLEGLLTGKIDFLCHAQRSEEREEKYLFSKYAVGSEISVLYVRRDDDRYYYDDYENFDRMTIAFLEGSYQNGQIAGYAEKKGFSYQSVFKDTQQECFALLREGKVDAVAMGSLALQNQYKVVYRFGADPFYFMTGKQNEELMDELDEAMGELYAANPTFSTDLNKKYYGDSGAALDITLTRDEAEYIDASEEVTIALIPNRKPFSYLNEKGEPDGIVVDIMKNIGKRSGFNFHYVMIPEGVKVNAYLSEHPTHLAAGVLTENPVFQTEEYVISEKFYSGNVILAYKNGGIFELDNPDASYKLAVPSSYMALKIYIEKNYPQFEIVEGASTEECMQMVLEGKADFLAQNMQVLTPLLQDPHYEDITVLPTFFMNEDMSVVGVQSEDNQVIMNVIDKCIATLTEDEISQYTMKHTITNSYRLTGSDMLYKFRYPLVAIAFLLIVIVALMLAYFIAQRQMYLKLEEKNVQLAQAVAQANSSNQAKSQFLARMSHEIRTPLNAITGLTSICRNYKDEPEKVDEFLQKIQTSSKVLLNLINDILDMSAIESNKIKMAENPFELKESLQAVSDIYVAQCKQKEIEFVVDTEAISHNELIGDTLRLNQILLNLVSNAYKFTPSGGRIELRAEEVSVQEGRAYINFYVKDTGEGMSKEMQKRLFLPFEQESADTARRHGGSGLGLSIAKNLVELMSGSISCSSRKGEGTVFTVSIPFLIDQKETVQEAEQASGGKISLEEYAKVLGGKKILMAEDTDFNAEIIKELLGLVGMEEDRAVNGAECCDIFRKSESGEYAAILMDVQMPVLDGYAATKVIRGMEHPDAKKIPVFAMTANTFAEDIANALNAGMTGHIGKPIDSEMLYDTLYHALKDKNTD